MLVKSMNGLQIELSGFRSEMKEFKKAVEKRMDCLDTRSTACQYNPNVCATARRLEEHIKADNGKAGRNMGPRIFRTSEGGTDTSYSTQRQFRGTRDEYRIRL